MLFMSAGHTYSHESDVVDVDVGALEVVDVADVADVVVVVSRSSGSSPLTSTVG